MRPLLNRKYIALIVLHILCISLYAWSLALPAFLFDGYPANLDGAQVLLMGWLGILVLDPRWLANVIFAICLLTNCNFAGQRILPLVELSLVIASFVLPVHYFPQDHGIPVQHFGPAVYLWALALIPVFLVSLYMKVPGNTLRDTANKNAST